MDADTICRRAENNKIISVFCIAVSLALLLAVPLGAVVAGERFYDVMVGFLRILFSSAKDTPDYFALGGLAATCLNAGLCGLCCSLFILLNKTPARAIVLAGFFLVVAHAFYGLNFLNMWPCFLGVAVYSKMRRLRFGENLASAMFATALAPFISELLFAFPHSLRFSVFGYRVSFVGLLLGLLASLLFGFIVPALLPGTTAMHRGFNLYKAGLAIGLFGIFIYALMFKTLGLVFVETPLPSQAGYDGAVGYPVFVNAVLGAIFLCSAVVGIVLCRGDLSGWRALMKKDGHQDDFCELFGMRTCLINIGVYGLFILLYFNLVILLTDGVGFTGNVMGLVFAAVTFSAAGQHPKNVFPVILGYAALSALVLAVSLVSGGELPWTLSTQCYLAGIAFATGLCPFSSKFGFGYGVLAGALSAVICSVTSQMHGGLMLYNGGFTAGLTALLLIPILDFYKVKEKTAD